MSEMIDRYSEPEQKDDIRYNCAHALALLRPHFRRILEASLPVYLLLMKALMKLLIDEYANVATSHPDPETSLQDRLQRYGPRCTQRQYRSGRVVPVGLH